MITSISVATIIFANANIVGATSANIGTDPVHFNWGYGSPQGQPVDGFQQSYIQKLNLIQGDYFIQTYADDGVRVDFNGKRVIDRWSNSGGTINQALLTNIAKGTHTVKTDYYENKGRAFVFSDTVKFGDWLAYYYPNKTLSGNPIEAKVLSGTGNHHNLEDTFTSLTETPSDNFSAKYTTFARIPAGEYVIRGRADDGMRVYLDGKRVIDDWNNGGFRETAVKVNVADKNGSNVHELRVEYYENKGQNKVQLNMQKYEDVKNTDGWIGEVYTNKTLTGNPIILGGNGALKEIDKLDFDWGNGSPHKTIPNDKYSARFFKKVTLDTATDYRMDVRANDGVRAFVNGKRVIDSWKWQSNPLRTANVGLRAGENTIELQYYEDTKTSALKAELTPTTYRVKNQPVAYNWSYGSPEGFPEDQFKGQFVNEKQLEKGDYFVQTYADDGVRVAFDGKRVIDRWTNSGGTINQALLPNVRAGKHTIQTDYYENKGRAFVFSDTVKFGDWLSYYYPNKNLSGNPVASKVVTAKDAFNLEDVISSIPGLPDDQFSATYTTFAKIEAGEYVFRAKSDDGIRVYLDGKKIVDDWNNGAYRETAVKVNVADKNGSNVHELKVEYYENVGISKVGLSVQKYEDVLDTNGWVGEIYPNQTLTGNPIILGGKGSLQEINSLNFDWGKGSPHPSIPADHYSARFTQMMQVPEAGNYNFNISANDGYKLFVNGLKVSEDWEYSPALWHQQNVHLDAGQNKIVVEYQEDTLSSHLKMKVADPKTFMPVDSTVRYNWGHGSPSDRLPVDHFRSIFDQSQHLESGDYFVQTFADDTVEMLVDGEKVISAQEQAGIERNLLTGVEAGMHEIITTHQETIGEAAVFADIVPVGDWLAYYYNNTTTRGYPVDAKVLKGKNLLEDNKTDAPTNKVQQDDFSAVYTSAQRMPAGDYVIRALADDGIKVYIDGELVIDRWDNSQYQENAMKVTVQDRKNVPASESDLHWVEVHYYDATGSSKVSLDIQSFQESINQAEWFAEVYPNVNLEGNPVIIGGVNSINAIEDVNFDWKDQSPSPFIPSDHFSMRLSKTMVANVAGAHTFKLWADDGVRLFVDGQKVLDSWEPSDPDYREVTVNLTKGKHTLQLEYSEVTGNAHVKMEIVEPVVKAPITYNYTNYNVTNDQALNMQLQTTPPPQTDTRYATYVYKSLVQVDNQDPSKGTVTLGGGNLNVRGGPGQNYWVVGQVSDGTQLKILGSEGDWYKIQFNQYWVNASPSDVAYHLNPQSVAKDAPEFFQFLKLSEPAYADASELNNKILYNKGIFKGTGQAFVDAGKIHNINELYLISHGLLETGYGRSVLASGVLVTSVDGKPVEPRTVYNMFGIHAFDSCPTTCGSEKAYKEGWFTPEAAIIGGAKFIADGYINHPTHQQDTLYEMRWNPKGMERYGYATHQYATDVGWAAKQVKNLKGFYDLLDNYTLTFDIPKFK
ncbi:PA14 domain-containing protein [Aquibacillus koreensis]|uniref:PA14 domain-containing protein n=1 Tax=Aquibacillus koreensis TaxID=279446 RepID=A0A9X3WHC3_9BACI|nr:PA14 domain-containing protein [Aquibacillus koreensis]MCT2535119.1 PA14 domain-containing protein [Aquibacillus koreensis]MDC3419762.1 PA14 domain-containing protein [Aquibacillus koreensis]